jgi:phosphatidylinositol glycan class N
MSHASHDDYSKPWGLAHLYRRDVEQADIAPLMAALIGIHWPVNSVGILPDVDVTRPGYLNVGDDAKARAALINAKVIFEQYRVKHGMSPSL